jgi:gluconate 2-dehydrogenase gamma chain
VSDDTQQTTSDASLSDAASAPVTRRDALKVLSVLPIAGAITGWAEAAPVEPPEHAHKTRRSASAGAPPAKRLFFTAAEMRLVSVLADDIIPRDASSGSATDAGVPAFMDYHLSLPETSDDARFTMRGGLQWLDRESRKRFSVGYARATVEQRHAVLDDIAWPKRMKPEFSTGTAFFTRFRDMVASGFYSSAVGWRDLRYTGNVPNMSWSGCPDAANAKLGVSQADMTPRIAPQ